MKVMRNRIRAMTQILIVSWIGLGTVATSPPVEPEPEPTPLEEPDQEPCGEAADEETIFLRQDTDPMLEGDRVSITVGGGFQGGDGDEGIDVYVHLDGVESNASDVTSLSIQFDTESGTRVAQFDDPEGQFFCFSGDYRTRVTRMNVVADTFDIDGQTGTAKVEFNLNGEPRSYELAVTF
jgi:hypothetical protein